ncbi:RNA polymerase sigma factor [Pseudonocardia nematodicida]|uniref:RNA polymerase sigma factor n=1 Tax=Pseudonocardia nematodicida TaxID=1206997 RepID=A0ABV1KF69_9PSEU
MTQRYGADGDHAESGRAAEVPHTDYGAYGYPGRAGDDRADEEAPPISGAMVQQHRTLPHGELRADFGAHLERHYPRLVAQLYAITLHPQDAHDAVQDAYSRAWRRWADLRRRVDDREDAVVGWVRRVAIRTSMRGRMWRFGRRRRPAPEETDPRTGALLEALGRLGPADRRAVVLHHMAGLSTGEVAALEGVAEQVVRQRLTRGREIVTEGMAEVLEEIVGPPGGPAAWDGGPYPDGGHELPGDRTVEGGRA